MWEQIRANRRRSAILISLMGVVLVLMGFAIGYLVVGPDGAAVGILVAAVIWVVQLLIAYSAGESILLSGVGAKELERDDSPRLFNVVEEMVIASGLGYMPKIYLIEDPTPNAFAVGTKPEKSAVAVTSGLMVRLNRDELQGVIAHEIGHLKNRDVEFMTLAGVLLGTIILLSEFLWRFMMYGGRGGSRSSSRGGGSGGGQAQVILLVLSLLVAILGPILAQLLYFACSRKREFLADASAAQYTRYPEGLASALEKIQRAGNALQVSKAVAPMFIVNPLRAADEGEGLGIMSTHPPTAMRVRILRSMAGAGLGAYEAAYRQASQRGLLGGRTLAEDKAMPIRQPSQEGPVESRQEARSTVHRLSGYIQVDCACGMTMRVPEMFENDEVVCIRCGAKNPLPAAKERFASYLEKAAPPPDGSELPPLHYARKSRAWESFRCDCGGTIQLSPTFSAPRTACPKCRRTIEVKPAAA